MGIKTKDLHSALAALGKQDEAMGAAIATHGLPQGRHSEGKGYTTMLRTIVGQQVSIKAAAAVWGRLESLLGPGCPPQTLLAQSEEALRACGLSRQKQGYARSLATMVVDGTVNFDDLPDDDEEAIALLTQIKGIGRWSAEIYLLFAEGRADMWPAGDLAVQEAVKRLLALDTRPNERETRAHGERWRPHRGAAAIFAWHYYKQTSAI